jgi:hypothetical protein
MSHFRHLILLLFLAPLVSGCAYLNQESIDKPFPGLRTAMKDSPVICLLFVHGMGGYSAGDPDNLVSAIKVALNLHAEDTRPTDISPTLGRQRFVDPSQHQLVIYTLNWEPVSTPIKQEYLGYDFTGNLVAERQPLEESLAGDVMYDRVSDVAAYAGVGKRNIQACVREALEAMQDDAEQSVAGGKQYRYYVVTWSLGSKIVFDCLSQNNLATDVQDSSAVKFDKIARHTDSFIMLANQLSLLAMTNPPSTTLDAAQPDSTSVDKFVSIRNSAKSAGEPAPPRRLSIVAFSDPNDVLSYPIAPWLEANGDADFANVALTIAHWAYFIPFLGATINPITAHTGYGSDPEVAHLIIEGGSATSK